MLDLEVKIYDKNLSLQGTITSAVEANGSDVQHGIGKGNFTIPATDTTAKNLCTPGYIAQVQLSLTVSNVHNICTIIIETREPTSENGINFYRYSGPDILEELQGRRVGVNNIFDYRLKSGEASSDIVNLGSYLGTWTIIRSTQSSAGSELIGNNESVFEALRAMQKQNPSDTFFRDPSTLRLLVWETDRDSIYQNSLSADMLPTYDQAYYDANSSNLPIFNLQTSWTHRPKPTRFNVWGAGFSEPFGITEAEGDVTVPPGFTVVWSDSLIIDTTAEVNGAYDHQEIRFSDIHPEDPDVPADVDRAAKLLFDAAISWYTNANSLVEEFTFDTYCRTRPNMGDNIDMDYNHGGIVIFGTYNIVGISRSISAGQYQTTITVSNDDGISDDPNFVSKKFAAIERQLKHGNAAGATAGGGGGDHGGLTGLTDDDHPQYLLADGSRNLGGNLNFSGAYTIDGMDPSAHLVDTDAHHAQVHALDGADHSLGSGTDQDVLSVDGSALGWQGTTTDGDTNPEDLLKTDANGDVTVTNLNAKTAVILPDIATNIGENGTTIGRTNKTLIISHPSLGTAVTADLNSLGTTTLKATSPSQAYVNAENDDAAGLAGSYYQNLIDSKGIKLIYMGSGSAGENLGGQVYKEAALSTINDAGLTLFGYSGINFVDNNDIFLQSNNDANLIIFRNLIPDLTDAVDLGSLNKKFRRGYLSELTAELFIMNYRSLMNGWFTVAHQAGTLAADVGPADTSIDFGPNVTIEEDDIVELRSLLQVEYVQVNDLNSGTRWNVDRNLDGSGPNSWTTDDPFWVKGQNANQDGYINLDAQNGKPRVSAHMVGTLYNNDIEYFRVGDISGIGGLPSSPTVCGLFLGSSTRYILYNETTNTLTLSGSLQVGPNNEVIIDNDGIQIKAATSLSFMDYNRINLVNDSDLFMGQLAFYDNDNNGVGEERKILLELQSPTYGGSDPKLELFQYESAGTAKSSALLIAQDIYTEGNIAHTGDLDLSGSITNTGATKAYIEVNDSWQTVSFENGWAQYQSYDVRYRITPFGKVEFRGMLDPSSATGNVIFSLPAAYQPAINQVGRISLRLEGSTYTINQTQLLSNGQVATYGWNTSMTWVSIENLTFNLDDPT